MSNIPAATTNAIDEDSCKLCNVNEIGDEFHYISKCQPFAKPEESYQILTVKGLHNIFFMFT